MLSFSSAHGKSRSGLQAIGLFTRKPQAWVEKDAVNQCTQSVVVSCKENIMPKRKRGIPFQAPTTSSCSKEDSLVSKNNDQEELTSCSTWVQCENTKCLKWRRIAAEAAQQLGDQPWYCWLNPDSKYNRCTVEEEKPKKPKHMKFVYSLLPVGQVVMARMSGYPLWPAILTTDLSYGEYYDTLMNKENEVTHYHVEFLGDPHSHAWVVPSGVHPFASVSDEDKIPKFRKLHGKRLTDLKKSFQLALSEAEILQAMDDSERLSGCHFHLKELTPNVEANVANGVNDTQPIQKEYVKQRSRCRSSSTVSSIEDDLCGNELNHSSMLGQRRTSSVESETIPQKEIDPEENNFMESLRTFLAGKGRSIHKEPRWRGKRVNLYGFYNTVQRYGGCEQVCKGRLWTCVYNELVGNMSQAGGGIGTTARHFYERYLLPFEVHQKNQSSVDVQFVPDTNDALSVRMASEVKTARTSAPFTIHGEQKVPEQSTSPFSDTDHKPDPPRGQELSYTSDCVPSSNPDSPSPYSDYSSDSEVEGDCEAAENELIQLERLLSSLEPSLYSPEEPNEISSEKQSSKIPNPCQSRHHPSLVLPQTSYFTNNHGMREEIDVLKTLDEMAKLEGAILELDSLAAIELDAL